jgi:hypothetical protein
LFDAGLLGGDEPEPAYWVASSVAKKAAPSLRELWLVPKYLDSLGGAARFLSLFGGENLR